MNRPRRQGRLEDVDRFKGVVIILVVFGHLVADKFPPGASWYETMNVLIYKFHMPCFMFVTGFTMFYSSRRPRGPQGYGGYLKRRFIRLVPAYVLFAAIIALSKVAAAKFVEVENPVSSVQDLIEPLWRPRSSYCGSLWYIYVAFIYYVTVPILAWLARGKMLLVAVAALPIHFLPGSTVLASEQVFEYLFVFCLGCQAGLSSDAYCALIRKWKLVWLFLFGGLLILGLVVDVPKLVLGVAGIGGIHSLVLTWPAARWRWLETVGQMTFPIYLMNTLVIGFVGAVIFSMVAKQGLYFSAAVPVLAIAGVAVPMILQRWVIRRVPGLRVIVR